MPVWWWDFLAMLTSKTITHLISNLLSNHRIIWEIVSNCVAFLENLSFKIEIDLIPSISPSPSVKVQIVGGKVS